MISQELKDFFDKCMTIDISLYRSWLVDDPKWTDKRIFDFKDGVVLGMYREQEPTLLSLMKNQYDNSELHRLLCIEVKKTNALKKKMLSDYYINMENAHVEQCPAKGENIIKWHKVYNSHMINQLSSESEDSIISFLYIYYAYEKYRTDRYAQSEREQPNIHEQYQDEKDVDFCKWNLVPVIDEHRVLKAYTPARIFDKQKALTLFVDLPKPFVEVLINLQECDMLGKLAVRCKDNGIFDGLLEREILCEDIEQGCIFCMDIISLPNITKLYDSKEYQNQLWIKKTDTDLTFEELCDDIEVEYDSIVTNMVHITYSGKTINHIDYEKIYYTVDEYESRTKQMNTKGTANKRQKYFKINDSCIPFDYPCKVLQSNKTEENEIKVPFILFVLNCFFTNRKLIGEYFANISG